MIKKRAVLYIAKEPLSDSVAMNNSSFSRRLLLEKILPPKKRDFKNIKDRLPKNKF